MILPNRRTIAQNMFDLAFADLPKDMRASIAFQICFYDFLLRTIDKKVITCLLEESSFPNSSRLEDIVYFNIINTMRFEDFHGQSIAHMLPAGVGGSYKEDLLLCAANRSNNDIKEMIEVTKQEFSDDEELSFLQMMANIYSIYGVEFNEKCYGKYVKTFSGYSAIVGCFFGEVVKSLEMIDPKTIIERAMICISNLSEWPIAMFATKATLLRILMNNSARNN